METVPLSTIHLKKSNPPHKWEVHIGNRTVKFGASGYEDYTISKNPE